MITYWHVGELKLTLNDWQLTYYELIVNYYDLRMTMK